MLKFFNFISWHANGKFREHLVYSVCALCTKTLLLYSAICLFLVSLLFRCASAGLRHMLEQIKNFSMNTYIIQIPLMYVRESSHNMLLNISDIQAYFSVGSIFFKSATFRENAKILSAQIPFRNKNSNNGTVYKKWRKEHVNAMIGFFGFSRQRTSRAFIMNYSKIFCLAAAKHYLKLIY